MLLDTTDSISISPFPRVLHNERKKKQHFSHQILRNFSAFHKKQGKWAH